MKVFSMVDFETKCKLQLIDWNNGNMLTKITVADIFVFWLCRSSQNYKCLCGTRFPDNNIYAEFTYVRDKEELYMDVYLKNEQGNHMNKSEANDIKNVKRKNTKE